MKALLSLFLYREPQAVMKSHTLGQIWNPEAKVITAIASFYVHVHFKFLSITIPWFYKTYIDQYHIALMYLY